MFGWIKDRCFERTTLDGVVLVQTVDNNFTNHTCWLRCDLTAHGQFGSLNNGLDYSRPSRSN